VEQRAGLGAHHVVGEHGGAAVGAGADPLAGVAVSGSSSRYRLSIR
jgi:hypothetical protein